MTAWLVEGGVILTFLTAVIGFTQARRKLESIHVLVNSNMKELTARVAQLTQALTASGVDVPDAPGRGEAGERLAP